MRKQFGLKQMSVFLALTLTVLFVVVPSLGCGLLSPPREDPTPTPEADLRFTQPSWESVGTSWYTANIAAVCDKKTGNLVYVMVGGERGGLAVIPGGCKDERDLLDNQ